MTLRLIIFDMTYDSNLCTIITPPDREPTGIPELSDQYFAFPVSSDSMAFLHCKHVPSPFFGLGVSSLSSAKKDFRHLAELSEWFSRMSFLSAFTL